MKKNITISLTDSLAQWARVEAAKAGVSLSRWIGDTLEGMRRGRTDQRAALQRFLAAPDFPGVTTDLPDREELYAERVFHRHERPALHQGPERTGKAGKGSRVARRSGR